MTSEEADILAMTREFAQGSIAPRAAAWDERRSFDDEVFSELAGLGFLGMGIPEEFDGLGFGPRLRLAVLEELARGDAGLTLSVSIQSGPVAGLILGYAPDGLRQEILPEIASGARLIALAAGETAETEAKPVPGESRWRLEGRKCWVVDGDRADAALVFARLGGANGEVAVFLVKTSAPGYRVVRRRETLGLSAAEIVEVELDGVPATAGQVVVRGAMADRCLGQVLELSRLGGAALAVGIAQSALDQALRYAGERQQFGRPLLRFGAIREKLTGMATHIAGARALIREVAREVAIRGSGGGSDQAGPHAQAANAPTARVARLAASKAAEYAAREAVQVLGGYGYMRDYPVEKLMRDAAGMGVCEATGEALELHRHRRWD